VWASPLPVTVRFVCAYAYVCMCMCMCERCTLDSELRAACPLSEWQLSK
jgi:hypothetical protein